MYKISIIIPVFNVEDTLKNAFDSIKSQTIGFENLEVIFVDDKSTDDSLKIIKEFSKKYNNVKSICLNKNSGFAGKPRNVGIENATAHMASRITVNIKECVPLPRPWNTYVEIIPPGNTTKNQAKI